MMLFNYAARYLTLHCVSSVLGSGYCHWLLFIYLLFFFFTLAAIEFQSVFGKFLFWNTIVVTWFWLTIWLCSCDLDCFSCLLLLIFNFPFYPICLSSHVVGHVVICCQSCPTNAASFARRFFPSITYMFVPIVEIMCSEPIN